MYWVEPVVKAGHGDGSLGRVEFRQERNQRLNRISDGTTVTTGMQILPRSAQRYFQRANAAAGDGDAG